MTRSVDTGLVAVSIASRKRLELNITAAFIGLALTASSLLGSEGTDERFVHARGANAPFLVRNRTGYPLSFWNQGAEDLTPANATILDDGADLPWRFDDWRKMREVSCSFGRENASPSLLTIEYLAPFRIFLPPVTTRLLCCSMA